MRLTEKTALIIRDATEEIFGSNATVTLFGSRVDDSARGGGYRFIDTIGSDHPRTAT